MMLSDRTERSLRADWIPLSPRFGDAARGGRIALAALLMALCVTLVGGCHRGKGNRSGISAAADAPRAVPDLSRTFKPYSLLSSSSRQPLSVIEQLARVSGGTWIALAPKPLDDVKWDPESMSRSGPISVEDALNLIRKSGTPVSWERRDSYLLVFFGPEADFQTVRAQPPEQMLGVLLAAQAPDLLTRAVASFWRLKITTSPQILQPWTDLLRVRGALRKSRTPVNALIGISSAAGGRYRGDQAEQPDLPPIMHLKIVDRLDRDELIRRLGSYLGGRSSQKGNSWDLQSLSDSDAALEAQKLKSQIEQNPASNASSFSSFASRSGEDSEDAESPSIPPLNEEIQIALDHLELLGKIGVPVLTGFLDASRPSLAEGAVQTLSEMQLPEGARALFQYYKKLTLPSSGPKGAMKDVLRTNLLETLARSPTGSNVEFLSGLVKDVTVPAEARASIRLSLLRAGIIEPFVRVPPDESKQRWTPPEMEFSLRPPPGGGAPSAIGPAPPGVITPLATTTLVNGDVWSVFLSPRLGDPNDIWLARGRPGRWDEFIFTGRQFHRAQSEYGSYGGDTPPRPGVCVIRVDGDQVTIAPADQGALREVQRLQKALTTASTSSKSQYSAYRTLASQYEQATRRIAGTLGVTYHLSLRDLRRDTDQDGLPQLVEYRLGTWQTRRDSDFDGIPDGQDQNPLAAPATHPSDRVQIFQLLFRALYGGDPGPDPIFVVLPHADWQEFYGARARVLCITPEDFLDRARRLVALRVLQFGGPQENDDTILLRDGPCLFNDDRSRAEVHFWQWVKLPTGSRYGTPSLDSISDGNVPVDYLARFERKGGWRLVSVRPLKSVDAAQATLLVAGRTMSNEWGD